MGTGALDGRGMVLDGDGGTGCCWVHGWVSGRGWNGGGLSLLGWRGEVLPRRGRALAVLEGRALLLCCFAGGGGAKLLVMEG